MLQFLSKYTITVAPTAARSICTKNNTYLIPRTLNSRLLQRPRFYPQFFRQNNFNGFATKPKKLIRKVEPTPVIAPKDFPGADIQPRLLDRLKSAGAISDLQAPPSLSHVHPRWRSILYLKLIDIH